MNQKRLRIFAALLDERLGSIPNATGARVYYLRDGDWFQLDRGTKISGATEVHLAQARASAQGVYRPPTSKTVYCWVAALDTVVVLDVTTAVKLPAQLTQKEGVRQIVEDAINRYRADHDDLTGLRNRSAFNRRLKLAAESVAATPDVAADEAASPTQRQNLILVSIDIDNFKTINDRFGHGYGDLVLASLALRLEQTAAALQEQGASSYTIEVFRLGGEEFQILITGGVKDQEAMQLASRIASAIKDEPLPSVGEHGTLSAADISDGIQLPHDRDRMVTVSGGVAGISSIFGDVEQVTKIVRRQADLALYSAKLGGRDQVRYFGEILERGGRVVSVDKINGIISIDIGEEVGVRKGQEFFLYPPQYDGKSPYILGEGRSSKVVGHFPKFRAARISTFDVQQGVSFCRVVSKEVGVTEIIVGSELEAIPLGSISHLFGDLSEEPFFADQELVEAELGKQIEDGRALVVAVSIPDIESISEDRGVARANDCLARIGRRLVNRLRPNSARLCQTAVGSFVAVLDLAGSEADSVAHALFEELKSELPDVAVGVGWIVWPNESDELRTMNASGLMDAALFSSVEAVAAKGPAAFSLRQWENALARSRRRGQYSRVLADYDRFTAHGLISPTSDTQLAFVHLFGPNINLELGESFLRRAAEAGGEVFKANLGGFLAASNRTGEAYEVVRDLKKLPPEYFAVVFYSAFKTLDARAFAALLHARAVDVNKMLNSDCHWITKPQVSELIGAIFTLAPGVIESKNSRPVG